MPALTILDRYAIRELLGPFILGVFGFVVIGMLDFLFTLVDMFINQDAPLVAVLRLLIFKVPVILVLFFPMAYLFATMLFLVRMAKDNELTVIRASGIPLGRLVLPVLVVGLIVSIFAFCNNEKLVPWTNHVSNNIIRELILRKPPPTLVEDVFFKDEGNRYFYIHRVDSKQNMMYDVMVYEITGEYPRVILAKTASWNAHTWTLHNGTMHKYHDDGLIDYEAKFETLQINVDRDVRSFYENQKSSIEMTTHELKAKIESLNKGGADIKDLNVDLFMKQAVPASSFVFGVVGAACCLLFVWSGRDWWGVIISVIAAVLLVGFFFFLTAMCRALGRGGMLGPFLSAWLPNIFYLTVGGLVLLKQSLFK